MSPVEPLPGWSAARLIIRGVVFELSAVGCVFGIAVEGLMPFPWYYWGTPFFVASLSLLAVAMIWTFHGYAKARREIAAGYTTVPKEARQHPEVWYLDLRTFTVISGPGEPRPRSGSRKDIDEHLRRSPR